MPTNSFSLPSFAKINCHLEVLGRRPDGYHEIFTIFQTISLKDTLTFESVEGESVTLSCQTAGIPTDDSNLVIRAATSLGARFGIGKGASINLEKSIPVGGGLGGGSSNAAVALVGLCRLWDLNPGRGDLFEIARTLGADVPFFLTGGTAAATGIGDRLLPLGDLDLSYLVVVTPEVQISSAIAYKSLNSRALTKDSSAIMLSVSDAEAFVHDAMPDGLRNDFEPLIFDIEPEVRRARESLVLLGARVSLMSGSGSSVFGIFDNREAQKFASEQLRNRAGWRVYTCSAVSREGYLDAFGQCAAFLRSDPSD